MKDYSGESVKLTHGSIKLIKRVGQPGGQGTVYRTEIDGKPYGFKILFPTNSLMERQKRININSLLKRKPELDRRIAKDGNGKFAFTFPIESAEIDGHLAYLMDWASGKDIHTLISDGPFDKFTLNERLEVIVNINEAFWFLSKDGLCYQDINAENIFYDVKSKKVTVIDTENTTDTYLVENGQSAFVTGKGFYMAPEVGASIVKYASKSSDYYAMAMLYYCILTCSTNSPYHGKVLYENFGLRGVEEMDEACENAKEDGLLEDFLTFAFDPENKVNSLESFYRENCGKFKDESNVGLIKHLGNIVNSWKEIPKNLKELFYRAFSDPLNEASYTRRPLPDTWATQLNRALGDCAQPKDNDKCALNVDKSPKSKLKPQPAPIAQGAMYVFNPSGDRLYLTEGETVITQDFVDGKCKGAFGKVQKRGDNFVFVRTSIWGIDVIKNNRYIYIGTCIDEIVLEEGMRICLSNNSKMYISVGKE